MCVDSFGQVPHTAAAKAAVGFWMNRISQSYFLYYDHGKSAVRVSSDACPTNVHEWLPGGGKTDGWLSNMTSPWDRKVRESNHGSIMYVFT